LALRTIARCGVLIAILLILTFIAAGCGKPAFAGNPSPSASPLSPTPSPKPTPTPTEPPKGTLVNGWIAGIPEYVPRFPYGVIDRDDSSIVEGAFSTVFGLCFTGVQTGDLDAYAETLKGKGYKVAVEEIGETYTLTASLEFSWGKVTLVITVPNAGGTAAYALDAPV
jgi:hypothetical protein